MRFRANRKLEKNREGRKGIGLVLVYPSAEAIELVGMFGGFDFIHLDGEHGLFSPESIDEMCRVAGGFGLTVTARVPDFGASTINQFLDRGVMGIMGRTSRPRRTRGRSSTRVDTCPTVSEAGAAGAARTTTAPRCSTPRTASAPSSCARSTPTCA